MASLNDLENSKFTILNLVMLKWLADMRSRSCSSIWFRTSVRFVISSGKYSPLAQTSFVPS